MMKYSDFEKQMAKKLRDEVADLDTAAFYKQLSQPAKKRKGAIIYWLSFLLVGCLSTGAYFFINNNTAKSTSYSFVPDSQIMDSTEEMPSLILTNDRLSASTTSSATSTENVLNSSTAQNTTTTTTTTKSINKPSDQKTFQNEANNEAKFSSDENNAEIEIADANSKHTVSSKTINTNQWSQRNETILENNRPSIPASSSDRLKTNLLDQPQASEKQNFENAQEVESQSTVETPSTANAIAANEEISKVDLTLSQSSKESIASSIPSLMLLPEEGNAFYRIDTKIECPDFRINKKRFDIEALAEIGYFRPIKSYGNDGAQGNEVDMLRVDHETTREGYHAAAYLKFIGRQVPLYLQVGIGQDFLTERMELEYSYIERDTMQGIISITTSEDGDTITAIIGDIVTETEISGRQRKHYRLQTIDLPLMAGYEFNFDRFSLGLEGGVVFNLRMRSTGNILTGANDFEKVDVNQPFRTNIGLSYLGGISLGYYLTPRSRLYLNTKMRFLPSEFNSSSNSLSQKYKFLGINVGYGYIF